MPISFEGLEYTRYTFKTLKTYDTGGCRADVYLPDSSLPGPYPIALHFHGGGFTFGDTAVLQEGHQKYLLDRGFAVVSAEYRMSPHADFAAQREDWVDAYAWVVNDLGKITGGKVDGSRVFVFGASAGGTATLFLGVDIPGAGLPPPKALYPCYPLTNWDLLTNGSEPYSNYEEHLKSRPADVQEAIRRLIAGPGTTGYDIGTLKSPWTPNPEIKDTPRMTWFTFVRETGMFPSAILGEDVPPSSRHVLLPLIPSNYPPTIILNPTADTTLSPKNSTDLYDRLQKLGVESKLVTVQGMEHGEVELISEEGRAEWEIRFREIFAPALDWCIAKCQ
ncbi:hypothetical protein M231_04329 [Tremella mesenterica]|uniref:Alpha/beta hydrolase fold-3 domain-containing protein n=1 Tax=Tremella mesenterica TaxID=5217 RepID=A0A4Q1BL64_TREME|nr:uncharacterized protein TREMEDRAFT_59190 [Tremella mesenterica DSM 1558]EIW73025.1 hypothetical protein TREMEDRAFT_59190 [Tremella mesenterica DSM 1558]RXK38420.1 hypothetical protein M231_04329 [Tremella mesenterica]